MRLVKVTLLVDLRIFSTMGGLEPASVGQSTILGGVTLYKRAQLPYSETQSAYIRAMNRCKLRIAAFTLGIAYSRQASIHSC